MLLVSFCSLIVITSCSTVNSLASSVSNTVDALTSIVTGNSNNNNKVDVRVLQQSCEMNNGIACAYLGYMYATGENVPKDIVTAKNLAEKGCSLGDNSACVVLGLIYYYGDVGIKRDYAKAKTIFKDTCKFNDNMSLASCSYLANIYMIEYEQNKVTKANSEIRKNLGLYRWVTCKQLPRFK